MLAFFEGIDVELKRRSARQVLLKTENVRGGAIERVDRDASTRGRGLGR
jgi:hypothetical protein